MNKIQKIVLISVISYSPIPCIAAGESGKPATTGNAVTNNQATQDVSAHSSDPKNPTKCTAHNKNYGEMYDSMWDKGPSIMAECGIGRLVDFDILKIFDPIGALLDAMQGAICGWVNHAVNPFVTSFNSTVSRANEWTSDRNRGYDDWVSDRQKAIYNELYAKHKKTRSAGLDDVGYPYDTIFTDQEDYPAGYIPSDGSEASDGTGQNNGGSEGSLDSTLNDGNVIIIGNDSPVIINQDIDRTPRRITPPPKTSNYDEIYDVFNKG